jgi:hypothetical protein
MPRLCRRSLQERIFAPSGPIQVFSSSCRASESPVRRSTIHSPDNSGNKASETQSSAFFRAVLNFGEAQPEMIYASDGSSVGGSSVLVIYPDQKVVISWVMNTEWLLRHD